jgi:hypothetical protein
MLVKHICGAADADATVEELLEVVCFMRFQHFRCSNGLAMRWVPAGKDVNTEAEEYTLLGAITQ